jgi:acyl carrier protein
MVMENKTILNHISKYVVAILDDTRIEINESTNSNELEDWCSLSFKEFTAYIENDFNININTKEILSCINIMDVINIINKKIITPNDKW